MARNDGTAPNAARLRVTLLGLDPAPWREFDVPLSMSFKGLHDTIQAAFLWWDSHLWMFDLGDRRFGPEADDLDFDPPVRRAANARLRLLAETGAESFVYTYDFGDDWRHRVEVLALFDAADAPLPRFLGGARAAPPEDVGGIPGFEAFLEAIADPAHPDHREATEWHGEPYDSADIQDWIIKAQFDRLSRARTRGRGAKRG